MKVPERLDTWEIFGSIGNDKIKILEKCPICGLPADIEEIKKYEICYTCYSGMAE